MNESIENRVADAERGLRVLRVMAAVLAAVLILLAGEGFLGPRSRSVVEAESFVVKDSSGHVRAELGLARGGSPSLVLKDSQGRKQAVFETRGDDEASLYFLDRGIPRIQIGKDGDGSSGLRLHGRDESTLLELGISVDGNSSFEITREKSSIRMGLGPNQPVGLSLKNVEGLETGSLGATRAVPTVNGTASNLGPLGN